MKIVNSITYSLILCFSIYLSPDSFASSGYDLWLGYNKIDNNELLEEYRNLFNSVHFVAKNPTHMVTKQEITMGLDGLLDQQTAILNHYRITAPALIIGDRNALPKKVVQALNVEWETLGDEGYVIKTIEINKETHLVISAPQDIGVLYGVYHFLRMLKTHQSFQDISIKESPKVDIRILNHWDNLDRTVERGYAGFSIWNWQKLPEYLDQRYIDYARANASIGINGTVLTNVNANALVLTPAYLEKVEALAKLFRPYGLKVYLTARFSAPMEIGNLKTADPLDAQVIAWWKKKADEIYTSIPNFGGFLVKANSEGQPGPQDYGRTHVDGANMLATAVKPHGGIVMWRAFVYSEQDITDRAKQAYNEFVPYDGKFHENVLVQVKNGPIDFQPREPFHPMFGAMPNTSLMMEFQITQEYLGFSTHLVFLPKLFEEVLAADTYQEGENSMVAKIIDGSLQGQKLTGMAGVSNIGTDINWTGHPFAQANWYGFGRLAWNPYLSGEQIADEWLRATFSNQEAFVEPMTDMLVRSRESVVKYMTPLGLHHIMDAGHHYGPGPWIIDMPRADWTSIYYHKADSMGIGFDRTGSGSKATAQYADKVARRFNDPEKCPEEFLLWFHHLPWAYEMKNKKSLWNNIALTYQEGVDDVKEMITSWQHMKPYVNEEQFNEVTMLMDIQLKEAKWWRDACLLYFQQFSKLPLPQGVEQPDHFLKYYQSLKFPYAPGIRPRWN